MNLSGTSSMIFTVLFFMLMSQPATGQLGIPGATATKSGYDTEMGTDPMCWRSPADQAPNANLTVPNPLVADFKLAGKIELMQECPKGNFLKATAPPEFIRGQRLRTHQIYNYSVDISLDLESLGATYFVSDLGPRVAVQIVICSLGDSGFCSPFIHEETNARLFKLGLPLKPAPGYRHGGSHVHSPYQFVDLPSSEGPRYNISVQVPMEVNEAGTYFAIAAVQMMVAHSIFPVEVRYDMANAMVNTKQRIIKYQDPPTILEVPFGVKLTSYITIGVSGSILLYLLVEMVRHRAHQVIRLTQGVFLVLFLTMALTATVASFLFEPKNDIYCQASYPILLICMQFMYAITLGRLWRINAMISPMLTRTIASRKSNMMDDTTQHCMECVANKLMSFIRHVAFFGAKERNRGIKSPRLKITDWHLAKVVLFLSVPQVILQLLSVTLQPRRRVIEYNADESIGRATCRAHDLPASQSILCYSCYAFLVLGLVLLAMAVGTRKLPSLFHETQDILDSSISSLILLVLGVAITLVTNEPTVSPGVQYLVWVVMVLTVCLNLSLRIMLPKLRMVWRGEVVLVSKLVSDHNRKLEQKKQQRIEPKKTTVFVSGLPEPCASPFRTASATPSNSLAVSQSMESSAMEEDTDSSHSQNDEEAPSPPNCTITDSNQEGESCLRRRAHRKSDRRRRCSAILISSNESPARRLVLKMINAQEQLAAVNERIISGLVVTEEDWELTRRLTSQLGESFKNDVLFTWEAQELLVEESESADEVMSGASAAIPMLNKALMEDNEQINYEENELLA